MRKKLFTFLILTISVQSSFGANKIYDTAYEIKQDTTLFNLYLKADSLYQSKQNEESLKIALSVLDKTEDQDLESKVNYLIGNIWLSARSYNKAREYFRSSLEGYIKINPNIHRGLTDDINYLRTNLQIGRSYHFLFELSENDPVNEKILKDSTHFYYSRILESQSLEKEAILLKSRVCNNLSGLYLRLSLYDEAEIYANKAIESYEKYGDVFLLASAYNSLSNVYFYKEEYKKSKTNLFKALDILSDIKGEKADDIRADLYLNISFSLYKLRDYRAYEYQEMSWRIYDTINKRKNDLKLADIYANRNFDKGIQEGVFREELKRQRAQRNTWVIGISLTLVIVILGSLLNRYKLKQKNLQLALSKKETESQMEVLNANLKGQEAERKRISQELHDGVLSRLFGSRMGLGYLELDGDQETQKQYENFLDELQNIEKEIRGVSHQLSSDISISDTSFINAVNQLLKEKSNLGKFDFQLKMDDGFSWKELGGVLEMNLFRILQESLQNIIKHAQAKQVFVSFKAEKKHLLLQIKDDGLGFDTQKKSGGIGLKNIESRVKELKGIFEITSEREKGTQLKISLPIQ